MTLTIDLPDEFEQRVRREVGDLDRAAKESLLANLYRDGIISHAEVGRVLALSRWEADALLKRHHAGREMSAEELRRDAEALPAPRMRKEPDGDRDQ
jgi:predicted HTH domain antitoxin